MLRELPDRKCNDQTAESSLTPSPRQNRSRPYSWMTYSGHAALAAAFLVCFAPVVLPPGYFKSHLVETTSAPHQAGIAVPDGKALLRSRFQEVQWPGNPVDDQGAQAGGGFVVQTELVKLTQAPA